MRAPICNSNSQHKEGGRRVDETMADKEVNRTERKQLLKVFASFDEIILRS